MTVVSLIVVGIAHFFLHETYAPIILQERKEHLASKEDYGTKYYVEGEDHSPVLTRIFHASQRPLWILLTQPIVLNMPSYQTVIFATMYALYSKFQDIWKDEFHFATIIIGLTYLAPALGFLTAAGTAIPRIDKIYNKLAEANGDDGKPEYRLPLANVGAVLLPISLFWFAWTVEYHVQWFPTLLSTFFFGENYYIDSLEK